VDGIPSILEGEIPYKKLCAFLERGEYHPNSEQKNIG
jgi:hypothetical protein